MLQPCGLDAGLIPCYFRASVVGRYLARDAYLKLHFISFEGIRLGAYLLNRHFPLRSVRQPWRY